MMFSLSFSKSTGILPRCRLGNAVAAASSSAQGLTSALPETTSALKILFALNL